MSKPSISDARNRCFRNAFSDTRNELSSNSDAKSRIGVINSSNCVINIDYLVKEEKISFEVFRSSLESNCVFRKRFSLRRSRSCMQLNSTGRIAIPVNKMVQTEANEMITSAQAQVLAPGNLGPPPPFFRTYRHEFPVRDTSNFHEVVHKESYGVSNFKFPENASINVVTHQCANYCSLDFDGTRSKKKKHKKSIIVKRVRSDINIQNPEEIVDINEHVMACHDAYDLNKFPTLKKQIIRETREVLEDKYRKKKCSGNMSNTTVRLKRKDRAVFEFILAPKDEKDSCRGKRENSEKSERQRNKHRKIIVTSNTLQLSNKPNMRNVELQTNMSRIQPKDSSVNELFVKKDFRVPSGDHLVSSKDKEKKKKSKRKKMTMTVFPTMEVIDVLPPYLEMPVPHKRVPIPRRRVDGKEESLVSKVTEKVTPIESKKQILPKKSQKELVKPKNDNKIEEKIENLFKDHISTNNNPEYNKKMDELFSLINSLVKEKSSTHKSSTNKSSTDSRSHSQSRSRSPSRAKSPKPEPLPKENLDLQNEPKKSKIENLNITHNEKDSVSIKSEDNKQNVIPRSVLKVSPRINEMLKNSEYKKKNTMVTYPSCIMPDPSKLNELKITAESQKFKEPMSKKRSSDTKNCSSVTFSSQISIIGDDSKLFKNDVNVKNTLFSINELREKKSDESVLKRSKTLPTKPEFRKPPSAKSNVGDLGSSMSNSDIGSVRNQAQSKIPKIKKAATERSKIPKPGALENSTFLSSKIQSTSNAFQKRKEYAKNLKLKNIKQRNETDSGRQTESKNESNAVSNVTSVTSHVPSNAASRSSSIHENISLKTSRNKSLSSHSNRNESLHSQRVGSLSLNSYKKDSVSLNSNKNESLSINTVRNESSTLTKSNITESESQSTSKSEKSRISLLKQRSKKDISPNKFSLKSRKDNNLFPYEFSEKDNSIKDEKSSKITNLSTEGCETYTYLSDKQTTEPQQRLSSGKQTTNVMSPYNVEEVKQQISTFLQSYPLEITSPPILSSRSPTTPHPYIEKSCLHHCLNTNTPRRM